MSDIYSENVSRFIAEYESVLPQKIHEDWIHLLPTVQSLILDVGTGSGRDAAWFAEQGHNVIAVDPAEKLLHEAQNIHTSPSIQWIRDKLPTLKKVFDLNLKFDLILLSAVWIHVAPKDRERAFRKLSNLLKPGGIIVISLRHGPCPDKRTIYPGTVEELKQLANHFLWEVVLVTESKDQLQRSDVFWSTVVLRSMDDGTSALPLLRHIIINDAKSSTYKLALLRVILRIADGAQGAVIDSDDHFVTLPFGLVALYWLKTFKKLVIDEKYNQHPSGTLGFDKAHFRALSDVSPYDLRIGNHFKGKIARNLSLALRDVRNTIKKMPAFYTTLPNSKEPVFPCASKPIRGMDSIKFDMEFFQAFGTFKVPRNLWDSMSQYACWIEPAIVNEWASLMAKYDGDQKRSLDKYHSALGWLNEERDTRVVREIVESLKFKGKPVYCVWTGDKLLSDHEIDHCFPFVYWPNNDLWNLMPAKRSANNKKRSRLPSALLLEKAHDLILDWWDIAYGAGDLQGRFFIEAESSLPFVKGLANYEDLESIFRGVCKQRIRLRANQQIAEWDGP